MMSQHNQDQLFELLVMIENNQGIMSPLIAICDDLALRERLIAQCEEKLPAEIKIYRLELDTEEPNMKGEIRQKVAAEPALQAGEPGVFMVTGAERLSFVSPQAGERTGIDKFMGYLQWTREGLMHYKYPIVLWITEQIYTQMVNLTDSVRALDFWSWRRGKFQFEPEAAPVSASKVDPVREPGELLFQPERVSWGEEEEPTGLPLEDLRELIGKLERRSPKDPKLGSLYDQLGERYRWRLKQGEAADAAQELQLAHDCFRRAIDLQTELGLKGDLVASFRHQGLLYFDRSEYQKAIESYQRSLELAREVGDKQGLSDSLNNLGHSYQLIGQYGEAIDFHQKSLIITQEIGDRRRKLTSLCNLGSVHGILGEYKESIHYNNQSLEIARQIGDRQKEAYVLGNLGNIHGCFEQYQDSIYFHEKSLEIIQEIGDRKAESKSLGNLGIIYARIGQYKKSISLHEKSLEIKRSTGELSGEGEILFNLGRTYEELGEYDVAITYYEQALLILRSTNYLRFIAYTLLKLGDIFTKLNHKWDANKSYKEARDLYRVMGVKKEVEMCDRRIRKLNQMPVAENVVAPATQFPKKQLELTGTPFHRWYRHQKHLWQTNKHPLQKLWRFCLRWLRRLRG